MMWIGNNHKLLLLISISFAIVVIKFFSPLYTGAISTSDDYTRCDACHIMEHDEFSRTSVHMSLQCTNCHNITDFAPDLYSHNATTFACIYCHTAQNANQFNNDAHNNFSNASNATNIFTGTNEMCIACHTQIELEVEWHSHKGMNINATINQNGTWSLGYSIHGDNVSTNYTNYTDFLNITNKP